MAPKRKDLFGGQKPWSPTDWTDSDDRVRGGVSQSYLDCAPYNPIAHFHGTLDIDTLGGAGFASQRTTGEERVWDVSGYDGVELSIISSDSKRYTFIIKDEFLPRLPDGREASTVSYEYEFHAELGKATAVRIPWTALKATYRGREKEDAAPLDLKGVRRFSLMMRSYFAQQKGPFSLKIGSISLYKGDEGEKGGVFPFPYKDDGEHHDVEKRKAMDSNNEQVERQGWWSWMVGLFEMCTDCIRRR